LDVVGRATPDLKSVVLGQLSKAAMEHDGSTTMHAGDGANDAQAFGAASVGMALAPDEQQDDKDSNENPNDSGQGQASSSGGAAAAAPEASLVQALASSRAELTTEDGRLTTVNDALRLSMAVSATARFSTEYAVVSAVGNACRMVAVYTLSGGASSMPVSIEWGAMIADLAIVLTLTLAPAAAVPTSLPVALPERQGSHQAGQLPLYRRTDSWAMLAVCAANYLATLLALALLGGPGLRPGVGPGVLDALDRPLLAIACLSGVGALLALAPRPPFALPVSRQPLLLALCSALVVLGLVIMVVPPESSRGLLSSPSLDVESPEGVAAISAVTLVCLGLPSGLRAALAVK
jgi:magnesium-transporting ATPase (P-type)